MRLKSTEYFPEEGYRESRITRISRSVNLPSQMDLEISDVLSSGTLEKIDDTISDAKSYAGSRTWSFSPRRPLTPRKVSSRLLQACILKRRLLLVNGLKMWQVLVSTKMTKGTGTLKAIISMPERNLWPRNYR